MSIENLVLLKKQQVWIMHTGSDMKEILFIVINYEINQMHSQSDVENSSA